MPTKAELQATVDQQAKEIESLKRMLSRAERELSGRLLPEEIPPENCLPIIRGWMQHFCMPWEVFWCYEHEQWCDELDGSFPYFMDANSCPQCRR